MALGTISKELRKSYASEKMEFNNHVITDHEANPWRTHEKTLVWSRKKDTSKPFYGFNNGLRH